MSVLCAVKFADGVITRMTVSGDCLYDSDGNISHSFDFGRALNLAVAAYESRMKRPPPLIKEPERIAGSPDILGMQYMFPNGKIETTTGAEYRRTLLFASIFNFKPDGDASPPQHDGKRGRQRPRSTAEWEELKRGRDLRRLARADPALRRELLNTFDTCPCCNRSLNHKPEDKAPNIVPLTAEEFAASGLADLGLSPEHVAWADPADLKEVACITSAEDLFDFLAERIIQRLPADKQNQARADWWKARDQRGRASVHETHDDK